MRIEKLFCTEFLEKVVDYVTSPPAWIRDHATYRKKSLIDGLRSVDLWIRKCVKSRVFCCAATRVPLSVWRGFTDHKYLHLSTVKTGCMVLEYMVHFY